MYRKIRSHPTTLEIYQRKLIDAGVITEEECKAISQRVLQEYEREYEAAKSYKADPLEWLASNWQGAAIGSLVAGRPCKYVCTVYSHDCWFTASYFLSLHIVVSLTH
jgi:Dehydrogenase E1 component